jgi:hypothetical protein
VFRFAGAQVGPIGNPVNELSVDLLRTRSVWASTGALSKFFHLFGELPLLTTAASASDLVPDAGPGNTPAGAAFRGRIDHIAGGGHRFCAADFTRTTSHLAILVPLAVVGETDPFNPFVIGMRGGDERDPLTGTRHWC